MAFRLTFGRATLGALVGTGSLTACGTILGIDPGTPFDGSSESAIDNDAAGQDGFPLATRSDARSPDDVMAESSLGDATSEPESGVQGDAVVADADAADVMDATESSGDASDGAPVGCVPPCGGGQRCAGNTCVCVPLDCAGRCGTVNDGCGNMVDCGGCDGGECMSNVCGCAPETTADACGMQQCGQATNNCGLTVNCGVAGGPGCPNGDVCLPDNTCCTPDNSAVCVTQCSGTATNNCGQLITCSSTICGTRQVCYEQQCCTPNGCSGSCVDNCGQPANQCCPETGPPPLDSGPPDSAPPDSGPPDSGPPDTGGPDTGPTCEANGAACTSAGQCCSTYCGEQSSTSAGTCVSACVAYGGSCSTAVVVGGNAEPCCYPYTCTSIVLPPSSSGVTPEIVPTEGVCE
jgi:hypothetical protein